MMKVECHIDNNKFSLLLNKLRDFSMKQRELSLALSEAKRLGTCKIFTSVNEKSVFKSLDSMLASGNVIINKDIIHLREDLKEMS